MVPDHEGVVGMFVDVSSTNKAIMRWAAGQFEEHEREFAVRWRRGLHAMGIESFERVLEAERIVLRKCASVTEAARLADELLWARAHQGAWLEYLLNEIEPTPSESMVIAGYLQARRAVLARAAPFAAFCLKVTLLYAICKRHQLIPVEDKDALDLQYLCYMPFCELFCTADKMQARLAPHLLREDQTILGIDELTAELRLRSEVENSESAMDGRLRGYAFGMYPLPIRGSLITKIYRKSWGDWRWGYGNEAIELTSEEKRQAREEAERIWRDAIAE